MNDQINPLPPQGKVSKPLGIIVVTALVTAVVVGLGVYGVVTKKQAKEDLLPNITNQPTQQEPARNNFTGQGKIEVLDTAWNKYTHESLGFSIKFPSQYAHSWGSCKWVASENSYRPETALVPTKIFEDPSSGTVHISSEYFYDLAQETAHGSENDGYTFSFAECNKIPNSLTIASLDAFFNQGWKIEARPVSTDAELDSYIKQRYGQECSLGTKKPAQQTGVFDIEINGDGKDLDETQCLINYVTVLKYSPDKQRAISFDLGQACTFYKEVDSYTCLDGEMADSLLFE